MTHDMPTRYNCAFYSEGVQGPDAACVAMLRQAGAVILGKTATVELASIGAPPATHNPYAPDHTPGGSSSGSAAAVAARQAPLALGTQTGGSMLRPASFCGVWGFKPTWGLISTEGIKPFAPSLDTLGWFGNSADDIGLLLDVFDPSPPAAAEPCTGLEGARIAVWHMPGWDQAGPNTRVAMAQVVQTLRAAGAVTIDLVLPDGVGDLAAIHRTIMFAEGARAFRREYRAGADKLHPRIADMVRTAGGYDAYDLCRALDAAASARAAFDDLVGHYDAVLAPSTLDVAPQGLGATGDMLFNAPFTLLHSPCVNVPMRAAHSRLPIGVTLASARGRDRSLLNVATRLEAALPNDYALYASQMPFD